MATRCNIVIKKDGKNTFQIYHHYDGYPEGVGAELSEMLIKANSLKKKPFTSPATLSDWLEDQDESYEVEGKQEKYGLHGDIEYLYVIDLNSNKITCYSCDLYRLDADDKKLINGQVEFSEDYYVKYSSSMFEEFDKINIVEEFTTVPIETLEDKVECQAGVYEVLRAFKYVVSEKVFRERLNYILTHLE